MENGCTHVHSLLSPVEVFHGSNPIGYTPDERVFLLVWVEQTTWAC